MSVSNGGQTLCHMIRPSKVSNTFNGLRAASLFSVCEGPRSLGGSDALGICPAFLRAYVAPGMYQTRGQGKWVFFVKVREMSENFGQCYGQI